MAHGEFVTFLDSDDFMYPACLNDAYNFSLANPECKFFHNLYELVDDSRRVIHKFRFPSLRNQYKALASGNFISCIGAFLHRSIYKDVRFNSDPRMIGAEDYEIWFSVIASHKLGRINRINSGVRDHPKRSVHEGVYLNLSYQEDYLIMKIRSSPELLQKFGAYIPRLRSNFALHKAVVSRGRGDFFSALRHFVTALVRDPAIVPTRRTMSVAYNLFNPTSR